MAGAASPCSPSTRLARDSLEPWLGAHARLLGRERFPWSTATLVFFAPAAGETFVTNTDVAARWE